MGKSGNIYSMLKKYIVSIDLGGTNLKISLLDEKFQIKYKNVLSTKSFDTKEGLIKGICQATEDIIENSRLKKSNILGIGLGVPGPVDNKSGVVHFFPNIPGFKEVRLANLIKTKLKIPVFIDNDAKLACLAEYKLGAGKGFKNILCLTLGTGVGAGIIINGELYRGKDNAAGELGHIPVNINGPRCPCGGWGCLEAYIGNKRILESAKKKFNRDISLEELTILAEKKNKSALEVWEAMSQYLAGALTSVINLINLDAIVIGGGIANAGHVFLDNVREIIDTRAMSVQAKRVKLFKAKLGSDAGMIGAGIYVKNELK